MRHVFATIAARIRSLVITLAAAVLLLIITLNALNVLSVPQLAEASQVVARVVLAVAVLAGVVLLALLLWKLPEYHVSKWQKLTPSIDAAKIETTLARHWLRSSVVSSWRPVSS